MIMCVYVYIYIYIYILRPRPGARDGSLPSSVGRRSAVRLRGELGLSGFNEYIYIYIYIYIHIYIYIYIYYTYIVYK